MKNTVALLGIIAMSALGVARADHHETAPAAAAAAKPDRVFTCIATDHGGVKRWEPATFIVYEGERVQFKLYNRIPKKPVAVHGFAIPAFSVKIEVLAENKDPVLVEFVADKAGLYDINCHLHPAHVGGQLLVLKK